MGVHIIRDMSMAAMYCSTTDWAFGPIFTDSDDYTAEERLESFLRYLGPACDPRSLDDQELLKKYGEWRTQEVAQRERELKEED